MNILFWLSSLAFATPDYTIVENKTPSIAYEKIYETLYEKHLEFTLEIEEANVTLKTSYYQQRGIVGKDFVLDVAELASTLFVEWAATQGLELYANGRRDYRHLAIYDINYDMLNNTNVMSHFPKVLKSINEYNGDVIIIGLYDAHIGANKIENVVFVSGNTEHTQAERANVIAHELAHWWCDYYRIYDNYYKIAEGDYDMEAPAEAFEKYFDERTNY